MAACLSLITVATVPTAATADSLTVSPTRLAVPNPNKQTSLTVKAGGKYLSVLQVRVMKWNERDDPAKMKPTRDVVISPPVAKLRPGQELTVRIVRVKKRAVRKRECYRVLVDRLPGREQSKKAVKLQVRHSVPLCFTS
ncbi:fimbria/pilus periplasmic chaperone [Rhodobacteraceae bacterium D3-12]|nr:fimbria/pilus periplasmic chaperone [Rhodobacteraceae bacterium D3-12]